MKDLPNLVKTFGVWWFITIPKRIFRTILKFSRIVASNLSLGINFKLLLVPIYGDYSAIGRFVGLIYRLAEIFAGLIVVLLLNISSLIAPLLWYLMPAILLDNKYEHKVILFLFYLIAVLIAFLREYFSSPRATVKTKTTDYQKMMSKDALQLYRIISSYNYTELVSLQKNRSFSNILNVTELNNNAFITKLSQTPKLDTQKILELSFKTANDLNSKYIEMEHIAYSLIANIPNINNILSEYTTTLEIVYESIKWISERNNQRHRLFFWQEDYEVPKISAAGKTKTGRVTPYLNQFSQDFTRMAGQGQIKKTLCHVDKMKRIAEILGSSKTNILITGEPGSGKTSIVTGIAYDITFGTEYESIKFKRIVSLETGKIISGSKNVGDIAERLTNSIKEAEQSGDIILFIDEIHSLVGAEETGNAELSNAYSVLEQALSSNKIQFIGATTTENYRKYIEPHGSFSRLFQIVELPEASKEETLSVLKQKSEELEQKYKILISYPALIKCVELSLKLIHYRVLPDKAIDILSRTCSKEASVDQYVTSNDISTEIADITQIPVAAITTDESQKLINIEQKMKEKVIGQDNAVIQVASALKRARLGIRNEGKPIASFLFVGTTGVGKTETAKVLAEEYFGNKNNILRLDMSEFQQIDSINKLLGSPDGKSLGFLTEGVRTKPFSLILLDEIEKAHTNILLTFLQVLDDGRLTDTSGKVIDFTNTIIIATSNVGTAAIQEIFNQTGEFKEMEEAALGEVRKRFANEFLNRFTGIVVFNPLNRDNLRDITKLLLNKISVKMEEKGVKLSYKPELIEELIKRGYQPEWGARPMARAIENSVESYLATKMLTKEIKSGDTVELGLEVFTI